MFKLENATKEFITEDIKTTALHNIDLVVDKGEFVAVMGPSGCGKSTLLNIIGTLDCLTSGLYLYENSDISKFSEKKLAYFRRGNLGFIFQNFNLLNSLSVLDNVLIPLKFTKHSKAEKKSMAKKALALVGMDHRLNHKPYQLSGGQQQRVAIARATVAKPSIILADEPTGNLDSLHSKNILEIISNINQLGTTVVMVTHSEEDASYTSRTVRMLDGKFISDSKRTGE